MYALLLIVFLQAQRPPDIASPHTPTISPQKEARQVQLAPPTKITTPHLNPESELMTHYQMGVEVGAQRETTSELKYKVAELEEKREKIDRPDINSLKDSRNHIIWTSSVLGTVFVTIGGILIGFKKIIWDDIIKPRLRKELTQT